MSPTTATDLTTRARNLFCRDRYATQLTGVVIDHVDVEQTCCTLQLQQEHRNAKGAVMGGVLFTLADLAFAVAVHTPLLAQTPPDEEVPLCWVSESATIHFLSPARSDTLVACTQRIRQGRNRALFQTTICDADDHPVALVTTSGARIDT
ncbi:MAG: PaaI family thioesterase [Bacteroidales bacterium]|nr:PaaI family thioesterase [Bacteroidales bacterium]